MRQQPQEYICRADFFDKAYNRAREILTEHVDKLHAVASVLLEKEKIEGEEFDRIFSE